MKDYTAAGSYYTIGHAAQMTGFSDRTIRSYISSGMLEGEKINGVWHFLPEQIEAFVRNPAVRPGIQSKRNALVYDFLINDRPVEPEICMILDIPEDCMKSRMEIADYFCDAISRGNFNSIRFSFDGVTDTARIILKGCAGDVLSLANGWYNLRRAR